MILVALEIGRALVAIFERARWGGGSATARIRTTRSRAIATVRLVRR